MTHTLHREGSENSLKNDFLLLVTRADGFNEIGSGEKFKKIIDIIFDVGPTNYGSYELGKNIFTGLTVEELKKATTDNARIRCVFSDRNKFKEVISRIVEADLGLSVTITGTLSALNEIIEELHLNPHSINLAMGIHGQVKKLPNDHFRKITTMCGHGLISPVLVKDVLIKIKKGRMTLEQASLELAKPCVCGIFNQDRAVSILEEILPEFSLEELLSMWVPIFLSKYQEEFMKNNQSKTFLGQRERGRWRKQKDWIYLKILKKVK